VRVTLIGGLSASWLLDPRVIESIVCADGIIELKGDKTSGDWRETGIWESNTGDTETGHIGLSGWRTSRTR
jgi:hypothetical protein